MTSKKKDDVVEVHDKRRIDDKGDVKEGVDLEKEKAELKKGEEVEAKPEEKMDEQKETAQKKEAFSNLPPVNFTTFVLSMASSAQVHLGLMPNPHTGKPEVSLPLAKHTIDILELMQKKTKGNLDATETQVLEQMLFELRMQYVEKSK